VTLSQASTGLDVVIVNWNTGRHLRECLLSMAAAQRSAFELRSVVVVDNASSDDSLDGVRDIPLPLHVVRNGENRGFAAACNQGASVGHADLVLFLNPDTRLFEQTLDLTVGFMTDSDGAEVGICGGRMFGDAGTPAFSCARFPTFTMFLARMTGLARVFPSLEQRLPAEATSESGPVDQVIGAYFMVRRPLFEALGGFDERFFVYFEEVDLSLRARQIGWASYFLASARVYHTGQVSSGQVRGERLFYLLRSRTEYARKHWSARKAGLLSGLILTVELPVRAIVAAARLRTDELAEVGRAARLYAGYVTAAARR
jgi:N-acetylglucosaminyl-diphospho-decaprenol L-rhamnosyltransferase